MLRVYGHPGLLAVAAAINGPDFTPFNEALFIKEPGRGASVAWHQDGVTHWQSPDWDQGVHGFNFMGQLYGCTAANGVWVVPGSHKRGKADIRKLVADAGSERLPDAVPIIAAPGDVAITNRQALHGSFANTSKDWRVTLNMGFHRRRSVLGVKGGGVHNKEAVYDAAAHPRTRPPDRLRHRRAPPALPWRDALRLQTARRRGPHLSLGREGQSRHQGLQSSRSQHLIALRGSMTAPEASGTVGG